MGPPWGIQNLYTPTLGGYPWQNFGGDPENPSQPTSAPKGGYQQQKVRPTRAALRKGVGRILQLIVGPPWEIKNIYTPTLGGDPWINFCIPQGGGQGETPPDFECPGALLQILPGVPPSAVRCEV